MDPRPLKCFCCGQTFDEQTLVDTVEIYASLACDLFAIDFTPVSLEFADLESFDALNINGRIVINRSRLRCYSLNLVLAHEVMHQYATPERFPDRVLRESYAEGMGLYLLLSTSSTYFIHLAATVGRLNYFAYTKDSLETAYSRNALIILQELSRKSTLKSIERLSLSAQRLPSHSICNVFALHSNQEIARIVDSNIMGTNQCSFLRSLEPSLPRTKYTKICDSPHDFLNQTSF